MKTFVINTVGINNQLGIYDEKKTLGEYISTETEKRGGSENLMEITQDLLREANIIIKDIELIIVALGPGSYTGSRAGLAFAKGIAHAGGINIVGVSLFDVMAVTDEDPLYPKTIEFDAGNGRRYSKDYENFEETMNTRDKGEVREADVPAKYDTEMVIDFFTLKDINSYGKEYFKRNGADDYSKLLPLYLKEPNITLPKKK